MTKNRNPLSARDVLARNIKQMRSELCLSQEALADKAELHRTYIGSIERSERNISIDNIERLAIALNVKVSDLLKEK